MYTRTYIYVYAYICIYIHMHAYTEAPCPRAGVRACNAPSVMRAQLPPATGTTMWQQPQPQAPPSGNSDNNTLLPPPVAVVVAVASLSPSPSSSHRCRRRRCTRALAPAVMHAFCNRPQAQPCGNSHNHRHNHVATPGNQRRRDTEGTDAERRAGEGQVMRDDLFSGRATRGGETQKERTQSVGQAKARS